MIKDANLLAAGYLTKDANLLEAGGGRCEGKISRFSLCLSFFIVLSDSEVRFGKINMKRIRSNDFQQFLTMFVFFATQ